MPYQLSWIIPQRVMLLELSGSMDEKDMRACDLDLVKMLEQGDPNAALIHQIVIMNDLMSKPSIKTLTALTSPKHPRNGWIVAMGVTNPLMKMVSNIASQLAKMRVRNVNSVGEAFEFLYKVDSTLPDRHMATAIIGENAR